MTASLTFTDDTGEATLSNIALLPSRFNNWTPNRVPIGPESVSLGLGTITRPVYRTDLTVALEINPIPGDDLPVVLRLKLHLMKGGTVTLSSINFLSSLFTSCVVAPQTIPSITLSDREMLEYSFSAILKAEEAFVSDFELEAADGDGGGGGGDSDSCYSGLSGVQDFGDSFCRYHPGDYEAFRVDSEELDRWGQPQANPLGTPSLKSGYMDSLIDYEGEDPSSSHSDFTDIDSGVHTRRVLRFTRLTSDTALDGLSWGGQAQLRGITPDAVHATGVVLPAYEDVVMRVVFAFSEGFEWIYPDSMLLLSANSQKGVESIIGFSRMQVLLENNSETEINQIALRWEFTLNGGEIGNPIVTTDDYVPLVDFADIADGVPRELIVRTRRYDDDAAHIELWFGVADGPLEKLQDIFPPYPTDAYYPDGHQGVRFTPQSVFTFLETYTGLISVPTLADEWYGMIEWEMFDGADLEDASWFDRLSFSEQPLASIVVTPDGDSVTEEDTLQFTANGFDASSVPTPTGPVVWSIDDPDGGSISTDGLLTAGTTPGNYIVTATAGPISGSADVTVAAPVVYATWNPADKSAGITLTNGNLTEEGSDGGSVRSTLGKSSGKWYWEIRFPDISNCEKTVGIANGSHDLSQACGDTADSWCYYGVTGDKRTNASDDSYGSLYGSTFGFTNTIGVALDMDNGKVFFAKNNVWQGSGNPVTGANPAFSGLTGTIYACIGSGLNGKATANFGATSFVYTPPSGYTRL